MRARYCQEPLSTLGKTRGPFLRADQRQQGGTARLLQVLEKVLHRLFSDPGSRSREH